MCSAQSQAVALAAELAALTGSAACVQELIGRIRVSAALPVALTDARRRALLVALARAGQYGHDVTAEGEYVWAEFDAHKSGSEPNILSFKES